MEDRRKVARNRLVSLTVVIDRGSGDVLGRIGNLSAQGIMICSDRPLPIDRIFALQIKLPDEVAGRTELNLQARSLWSQRAVDPTYYATGFEIQELSDPDQRVLQLLIQDAVFQRWIS